MIPKSFLIRWRKNVSYLFAAHPHHSVYRPRSILHQFTSLVRARFIRVRTKYSYVYNVECITDRVFVVVLLVLVLVLLANSYFLILLVYIALAAI